MSKLLFIPFSVLGGILAGIIAKKIFDVLRSALDEAEPPNPKYRDIAMEKLIPALLLEDAIFRIIRGLVDHGMRHAYSRLTGSWPGEERPEPA
jgi:hypothetical protein